MADQEKWSCVAFGRTARTLAGGSRACGNRTDVSFHGMYNADQGKLELEMDLVDLPSLLASQETRIQGFSFALTRSTRENNSG
jgi:hypothetical protein